MTLEINRLTEAIAEAGAKLAAQAGEQRQMVPRALDQLRAAAQMAGLESRVALARERNWQGAVPVAGEPIDRRVPTPPMPERMAVVAADGSQIFPDKHSPMNYYVLNIGAVVLHVNSGEAPAIVNRPSLAFEDHDMLINDYPISSAVVSLRRSQQEMAMLAEQATGVRHDARFPTDYRIVVIYDGQLAIRGRADTVPSAELAVLQQNYLSALDTLHDRRAMLAGYVDRPNTGAVMSLLDLAAQDEARLDYYLAQEHHTPYNGLRDRSMFRNYLQPGERSAVFEIESGWNREYRREPGQPGINHSIHFFYLNVGAIGDPHIARVELPAWVASDSSGLDALHAALVSQCKVALDLKYPYVLTRADEVAVIRSPEKEAVEDMLTVEMMKHGLTAEVSPKLAGKRAARYGGRR